MTNAEFLERLNAAERLVNSWPEWKRHVLVKTSSPTVDVPRKPMSPWISDAVAANAAWRK